MPLLLIDEAPASAAEVRRTLVRARFSTDWAQSAGEALAMAGSRDYDALVLQQGAAPLDALCLLGSLRRAGSASPVLILSTGAALRDRLEALAAGADDCLEQPFDPRELIARVRALMRCRANTAMPEIRFGTLRLNPLQRSLTEAGRTIPVTMIELDILEALMRRPGMLLSRERLELLVYGDISSKASNAIEVHLHNLRRKLRPGLIRNVRGAGYGLFEVLE